MVSCKECLKHAAEAEEVAALVSLRTDKDRLMREAAEWRRRAQAAPPGDTKP